MTSPCVGPSFLLTELQRWWLLGCNGATRRPLCDVQVVKSDTATVFVPELELEIPRETQRGQITTVEGLLVDTADNIR